MNLLQITSLQFVLYACKINRERSKIFGKKCKREVSHSFEEIRSIVLLILLVTCRNIFLLSENDGDRDLMDTSLTALCECDLHSGPAGAAPFRNFRLMNFASRPESIIDCVLCSCA